MRQVGCYALGRVRALGLAPVLLSLALGCASGVSDPAASDLGVMSPHPFAGSSATSLGGAGSGAQSGVIPGAGGSSAMQLPGAGAGSALAGSGAGAGMSGGLAGTGMVSLPTGGTGPAVTGTAGVMAMPMPMVPFDGEPTIPEVQGTCPSFGLGGATFTANGGSVDFTIWGGSGQGGGALVIYWHGTGASGSEVLSAFGQGNIDAVVAEGGIVAAAELTSNVGTTTTDLVWTTGDGDVADQLVACAVKEHGIDPHRIHTLGYSAGGMQTTYMWYSRSNYIASVCAYSGGPFIINVTPMPVPYLPPAVIAHGAAGLDALVVDFGTVSVDWGHEIAMKGGLAIDCDDGSAHIDTLTRFSIADNVWQFFKDHSYNVQPEPYTSLTGWPGHCKIVQ